MGAKMVKLIRLTKDEADNKGIRYDYTAEIEYPDDTTKKYIGLINKESIFIYGVNKNKESVFFHEQIDFEDWEQLTWDSHFIKTVAVFKNNRRSKTLRIMDNNQKELLAFIKEKAPVEVTVNKRSWFNKLVGYRSKKIWKMAIATIVYLFIIGWIGGAIFGEDTTNEADKAKVSGAQTSEKESSPDKKEEPVPKKEEPANDVPVWKTKIDNVAESDKDKTGKFDEIDFYVLDYKPTEKEIAEFEDYILSEYESGQYLSQIDNDEYMLENIFKSRAVERYYDDKEHKPIDSFAFDFYQNTKYTYRGVDAPDSDAVKENEEQMDKALKEMK